MKKFLVEFKFRAVRIVAILLLLNAVPVIAAETASKTNSNEPPPLSTEVVKLVSAHKTLTATEDINWIRRMDLSPTQKAQALLIVLPKQNEDGQRDVAHAVVTCLDEKNYAVLRRPLLEAKLGRQVLSIFLTYTLQRPNRIKIPVLLDLARIESHPMQSEARELLMAFSGQDHGTNWVKWDQTMNAWLVTNPN